MKISNKAIILLLILSLLYSNPVASAPGDTIGEAVTAVLGSNSGSIASTSDSYYFNFTTDSSQYYGLDLWGPDNSDFDMDIYDSQGNYIDGAYGISYPDTVKIQGTGDIVIIEIYALEGNGSFTLDIYYSDVLASARYSDSLLVGDTYNWFTTIDTNNITYTEEFLGVSDGDYFDLDVVGSQRSFTSDEILGTTFTNTFSMYWNGGPEDFLVYIFLAPVETTSNEGFTYGSSLYFESNIYPYDSVDFYDYGDFWEVWLVSDTYETWYLVYDAVTGLMTQFYIYHSNPDTGDYVEMFIDLTSPLDSSVSAGQYSSDLNAGDVYEWQVSLIGSDMDFSPFSDGSLIELHVLEDAPYITYGGNLGLDQYESDPDLSPYFELFYDGSHAEYQGDIAVFVVPIAVWFSDGTTGGPDAYIQEMLFGDIGSIYYYSDVVAFDLISGDFSIYAEWSLETGLLMHYEMIFTNDTYSFEFYIDPTGPFGVYPTAVQFYSELQDGDVFTWDVALTGSFPSDGTDEPPFEDGSVIELRVLQDAPSFTFSDSSDPDFTTAFTLLFDGGDQGNENILIFILPVSIDLSDGTTVGMEWVVEEMDFFGDTGTVYSSGSNIVYESSIESFFVRIEWDTTTGLLVSFDMSSDEPGYEFDLSITRSADFVDPGEEEEGDLAPGLDLGDLPISPYVFILTLIAIPMLRRRLKQ